MLSSGLWYPTVVVGCSVPRLDAYTPSRDDDLQLIILGINSWGLDKGLVFSLERSTGAGFLVPNTPWHWSRDWSGDSRTLQKEWQMVEYSSITESVYAVTSVPARYKRISCTCTVYLVVSQLHVRSIARLNITSGLAAFPNLYRIMLSGDCVWSVTSIHPETERCRN